MREDKDKFLEWLLSDFNGHHYDDDCKGYKSNSKEIILILLDKIKDLEKEIEELKK